jgi:hypothetical protein
MKNIFVIGGGRWGRIIANKFSELGINAITVTEHKVLPSDISRIHSINSNIRPDLIFIASKTEDHWKDFLYFSGFKCPIWIEKCFHEIPEESENIFFGRENLIFNYYLFDHKINSIKEKIESKIFIHSFIEKPINNRIEYCDWISHELSIITRFLFAKDSASHSISEPIFNVINSQKFTLSFDINNIKIEILTEISEYRFREIIFDNMHVFHNYWDGFIQQGKADLDQAIVKMRVLVKPDLLSLSIQNALNSKSSDKIKLSNFLFSLQKEIFNCVSF